MSSVEGYLVNSDTGVLTIQKVERDDAGNFKCLAINSADNDSKETKVSVIGTKFILHTCYRKSPLPEFKNVFLDFANS